MIATHGRANPGRFRTLEHTMPKVSPFVLSEKTKAEVEAALAPLKQTEKKAVIDAMASMAAEVEIHVRKAAMEDLRQQWAETLRVMLAMDVRPPKKH